MSISMAAWITIGVIVAGYLITRFGRVLGGLILVLCLIGAGIFALVHSFQAFNATALVATVQASPIVNQSHVMAISMTTYDAYGNPTRAEYELGGDRWELNADVVAWQPWVNFLGISNGFQISRLTSQYDDSSAHAVQPVDLQHGQTFAIPFIERSHYRNGVIMPDDGVKYNIYVTLQGDMYATHA